MKTKWLLRLPLALPIILFASCSGQQVGPNDAGKDVTPVKGCSASHSPPAFCDLPGSLVFGPAGPKCSVAGGLSAPSLDWLSLPDGFCAHYFASVPTARQIRFAPGGELFVASPSTPTAGGAPAGLGAVVVLYDDNGDGFADGDALPHTDGGAQKLTEFVHAASTQGLLFAPGSFYYQDGPRIMKLPYASGQRSPMGTAAPVVDVTIYQDSTHWPKTLDIADDGTIYVGNGGDQGEICNASVFPRPFHGGILQIDGTPGGTPVARGFRNPIAVACEKGKGLCFAAELGLDGSGDQGGREKIVPIRKGDDWGFPCCATTNKPYASVSGSPNCSMVAGEKVALVIGDTPFGIDFEPGSWPAPYARNMLVTLHGQVSTWTGARVVAIPTAADGMPVESSDLASSTVPAFASGWDDGTLAHGRPAAVAFSADGRAFIANDQTGDIFWVAPAGLGRSH